MHTQLLGTWALHSWWIDGPDNLRSAPFGTSPSGLLIYTADGWMSAAIGEADREFSAHRPLRKRSAAELAGAYRSYFHYAGRYWVEGMEVIHSVVLSLNPEMVGTEQRRRVEWHEHALTLIGDETIGERQRRHTLTWRRPAEGGLR